MFSILKYTMAEIEIALHSRMSVFSVFSHHFFLWDRDPLTDIIYAKISAVVMIG